MTWFAVLKQSSLPGNNLEEWFNHLKDDDSINALASMIKLTIGEKVPGKKLTYEQMSRFGKTPNQVTAILRPQIEEEYGEPTLEVKIPIRERYKKFHDEIYPLLQERFSTGGITKVKSGRLNKLVKLFTDAAEELREGVEINWQQLTDAIESHYPDLGKNVRRLETLRHKIGEKDSIEIARNIPEGHETLTKVFGSSAGEMETGYRVAEIDKDKAVEFLDILLSRKYKGQQIGPLMNRYRRVFGTDLLKRTKTKHIANKVLKDIILEQDNMDSAVEMDNWIKQLENKFKFNENILRKDYLEQGIKGKINVPGVPKPDVSENTGKYTEAGVNSWKRSVEERIDSGEGKEYNDYMEWISERKGKISQVLEGIPKVFADFMSQVAIGLQNNNEHAMKVMKTLYSDEQIKDFLKTKQEWSKYREAPSLKDPEVKIRAHDIPTRGTEWGNIINELYDYLVKGDRGERDKSEFKLIRRAYSRYKEDKPEQDPEFHLQEAVGEESTLESVIDRFSSKVEKAVANLVLGAYIEGVDLNNLLIGNIKGRYRMGTEDVDFVEVVNILGEAETQWVGKTSLHARAAGHGQLADVISDVGNTIESSEEPSEKKILETPDLFDNEIKELSRSINDSMRNIKEGLATVVSMILRDIRMNATKVNEELGFNILPVLARDGFMEKVEEDG